MNKMLLATGLIVATTMSAQSKCNFYCEVGVGASMTTMKYKNDSPAQNSVLDVDEVVKKNGVDPTGEKFAVVNDGNNIREETTTSGRVRGLGYPSANFLLEDKKNINISEMKGIKKKGLLPQVDITFGTRFVIGKVFLGIGASFEHKFGKTSKTEKGLNMNGKYVINTAEKYVEPGEDLCPINKSMKLIPVSDTKLKHQLKDIFDLNPTYLNEDNQGDKVVDLYDKEVYDSNLDTEITTKNKFNISIMPEFGVNVNDRLSFYTTIGIVVTSNKYTIKFPNVRSKADESMHKTVTKAVPRVGLGAIINLGEQSRTYVKLGYYYTFKSKGKAKIEDREMTNTFETSDQLIRLGIGIRF